MSTDEQLMMRSADGDRDAFGELVRRHQESAINTAYHFLGDAIRAEDVAQEAFLKILAGAHRYQPTARFKTYLYNVVWHLCVDIYRKAEPQRLPAAPRRADSEDGPERAALRRETSSEVRRAIDRLPARQRMALVLQHYQGLSYEEIAEALDCTAGAVDSLLVRARRKLRDSLQHLL